MRNGPDKKASMAAAPRDFNVFISHRSTDRDTSLAVVLKEKLYERGIAAFLDTQNIPDGVPYSDVIFDNIRRSRLLVVFFDADISSWVHFEASCAFFDQKLLPVSIDGAKVPSPYDTIQHDNVNIDAEDHFDDSALERIADEVQRRLQGRPRHAVSSAVYIHLNRFFDKGLHLLFASLFAIILLGYAPGTVYDHLYHLHVVIGAAILGGQFFLSLAFANAVASPSFREREYGFSTAEKLFVVWIVITLVQPALGLWLVLSSHAKYSMAPWVWLSLVLYVLALFFTVVGYVCARNARALDRHHASHHVVNRLYLLVNCLFLAGFVLTVGVVNVMIKKPDILTEQSSTVSPIVSGMECGAIQELLGLKGCSR